jgi:predicted nucleotidyltransferase
MNKKRKSLDVSEKERLVEKICLFLQRQCDEIVAGYLFGSFNTAERFSDIDLALLVKDHEKNPVDRELGKLPEDVFIKDPDKLGSSKYHFIVAI